MGVRHLLGNWEDYIIVVKAFDFGASMATADPAAGFNKKVTKKPFYNRQTKIRRVPGVGVKGFRRTPLSGSRVGCRNSPKR